MVCLEVIVRVICLQEIDGEKKEKTQSLNHSQDWWKPAVF